MNLGYKTHHLGASPDTISDLADGVHPWCEQLFSAKRPMILAGSGIHARPDSHGFNIELQRLAETIKSNVKQESDDGIVSFVDLVTFSITHYLGLLFQPRNFQSTSSTRITTGCPWPRLETWCKWNSQGRFRQYSVLFFDEIYIKLSERQNLMFSFFWVLMGVKCPVLTCATSIKLRVSQITQLSFISVSARVYF